MLAKRVWLIFVMMRGCFAVTCRLWNSVQQRIPLIFVSSSKICARGQNNILLPRRRHRATLRMSGFGSPAEALFQQTGIPQPRGRHRAARTRSVRPAFLPPAMCY